MTVEQVFSVSEFVAVLNQTLEFAYPNIVIVGELANFRVSKSRWVYFDLKDESATVKFFGTVYMLPGPLEDGLLLQVRGAPRLHPQFGFSVNVQNIQPVGRGSLKRAAALLEAKLRAEGLFEPQRKRLLPHPPQQIGLITSRESAAYHDFMKILNDRWGGVEVTLADVQVQGEASPVQIVRAIKYFNEQALAPEVLIITRGGGSAEDLAAFNTEQVTRAVAASRIPTLVAIGHEVDISLAELAADQRASTPSNAAQLLVPDKHYELDRLKANHESLGQLLSDLVANGKLLLNQQVVQLNQLITQYLTQQNAFLNSKIGLLEALSPQNALKRGYAIIHKGTKAIISVQQLHPEDDISIQLADGGANATITGISIR